MAENFDLIVVGAGPSGLSAAINGASEGLSVLVLDSNKQVGGQARYSAAIENYLGFPQGITGRQLALRAAKQAKKFGVLIKTSTKVLQTTYAGLEKGVETSGGWFSSKALVIACGLKWRQLDSDHSQYDGSLMYGGDKDHAHRFKGQKIVIVGGGNSAGQAALHWSKFGDVILSAKYPIEKTMSRYLVERIKAKGIQVLEESKLERMLGTQCELTQTSVPCDVVIPFVGAVPQSEFAKGVCDCDGDGYLTEPKCPGVFTVGDCRAGTVKRIAVAVGDGAAAIGGVHQYLASIKSK